MKAFASLMNLGGFHLNGRLAAILVALQQSFKVSGFRIFSGAASACLPGAQQSETRE